MAFLGRFHLQGWHIIVPESYRQISGVMLTGLDEDTKLQSFKSINLKTLTHDLPTLSWGVEEKLKVGDWKAALEEYEQDRKVITPIYFINSNVDHSNKLTLVPGAPEIQPRDDFMDIESSIRSFRYQVESSRSRVAVATSALTAERDDALRVDESLCTIIDKIRRE